MVPRFTFADLELDLAGFQFFVVSDVVVASRMFIFARSILKHFLARRGVDR